jgi:uncharacterized protein YpmB
MELIKGNVVNTKRTIGIILIVVGVITVFYANFQKQRIAEAGAKAYQQIEQGNQLFQGNPVGQALGGAATGSFKKKTASEIAKYNHLVQIVMIGGIIVAVVGAGMAIFCSKKTKKKKKKR